MMLVCVVKEELRGGVMVLNDVRRRWADIRG